MFLQEETKGTKASIDPRQNASFPWLSSVQIIHICVHSRSFAVKLRGSGLAGLMQLIGSVLRNTLGIYCLRRPLKIPAVYSSGLLGNICSSGLRRPFASKCISPA
jgi:hypothetical protein